MFRYIMAVIGAFLLLLAFGWFLAIHDIAFQTVFRPMQENVNRQVFENTKSYNQGMAQELQSMQFEYIRAPKEKQGLLASVILQRTADYDINRLSPDLRAFIENLRRERGGY